MLKGIPKVISPDLMKALMEMGHGDEIVLADGNFPAASNTMNLIRADGIGIPELLEAILSLFPLDPYVEKPVALMQAVEGDAIPDIWKQYHEIVDRYEDSAVGREYVERFDFYERARKAYAIVATGEQTSYANIILKKGVITS